MSLVGLLILLVFVLADTVSAQQLLANPRCNHWPDRGTCDRDFTIKWYYDRYDHRCRRFFFGGCDGNENRFDTLEECSRQCQYTEPTNRDRCFQPHDPGHCHADIERWYFDMNKKQCVCSWWSGCGGNSNIYYSYNHCMLICGEYAEHGPGIDEAYWGRKNHTAMSIESQGVFAQPSLNPPQQGYYSVQVPRDQNLDYPPQEVQYPVPYHFEQPNDFLTTINISHVDDAPTAQYLTSPGEQFIWGRWMNSTKAKGDKIFRFDSQPRQLIEHDLSSSDGHNYIVRPINTQDSVSTQLPPQLRRRIKYIQRKKIPPRMIHLGRNGPAKVSQESVKHVYQVSNNDLNDSPRNANYQDGFLVRTQNTEPQVPVQTLITTPEPNHQAPFEPSSQLEQLHQKTAEASIQAAQETYRKVTEEQNNLLQPNNPSHPAHSLNNQASPQELLTSNAEPQVDNTQHQEVLDRFRSHLEDHKIKLRKQLEAQFPDHIITLTPEIETEVQPDGRQIVRQRIKWTAHPKQMYAQVPSSYLVQVPVPTSPSQNLFNRVPAVPLPNNYDNQERQNTARVAAVDSDRDSVSARSDQNQPDEATQDDVSTTVPTTIQFTTTLSPLQIHAQQQAEYQKQLEEQQRKISEVIKQRDERLRQWKEEQKRKVEEALEEQKRRANEAAKQQEELLKKREQQQKEQEELVKQRELQQKKKVEEALAEQKRRVDEATKKQEELLKQWKQQQKEHQEAIQKQRERDLAAHREQIEKVRQAQEALRQQHEKNMANRLAQVRGQRPASVPVTTEEPIQDDRIVIPNLTWPTDSSFTDMGSQQNVIDAHIRKHAIATPTRRVPAESMEHYRPIIEQVTSAPLSIEDIIAMDNAANDDEEEYEMPMDFPAEITTRPPTRRPAIAPPPPPRYQSPVNARSHGSSQLSPIVFPVGQEVRNDPVSQQSNRQNPNDDIDEYTQNLEFGMEHFAGDY